MKKIFSLMALAVLTISLLKAAVVTVDNNVNSGADYTDLQTAIDAVSIGDTLLVSASPNTYGSTINLRKSMTLIGEGSKTLDGKRVYVSSFSLQRLNASIGADNVHISGFEFSSINFYPYYAGITGTAAKLSNISITRCKFSSATFSPVNIDTKFSNINISNNLISGAVKFNWYSTAYQQLEDNVVIENNIFNGAYISGSRYSYNSSYYLDLKDVTVRNNIFINRTSDNFSNTVNLVINNNIFYGATPRGCYDCTFNNNITYITSNDTIPYGGGNGSGNKINTDPKFVYFSVTGGAFDYKYDFNLKSTSTGKNAGTDGTDIGIYGGNYPGDMGALPRYPFVSLLDFQGKSAAPKGGNLNIHFEATKQE